jgi:glutamyl-tRNA reductase
MYNAGMLYILGFNHKSAPLHLREQLAYTSTQEGIYTLARAAGLELVILSTCHRTEFITTANNEAWLNDCLSNILAVGWQDCSYNYRDEAALAQLLRVAIGLDSVVLGEPQILGQLKQAFAHAVESGVTRNYLGHLFPFVFATAKKIRLQTAINTNSLSIAYTAVNLAKNIFTDLKKARVLLIGAGEMISLVAQYLYDLPVANMIIANRTIEKSELLVKKFNGKVNATAIAIGDIPYCLANIDIVISCTASQLPILGKGLLERVIKQRKHKPIFMVDLAMPRDIEPEVANLDDVYLYNIDDLQTIVQKNQQRREYAALQAELIIQHEIEHFIRWQNTLQAIPLICQYRENMIHIRDIEVAKALRAIQRGQDATKVVEQLGYSLTQKLLHGPTVELRRASYEGRFKLLDWAKQLLQLR